MTLRAFAAVANRWTAALRHRLAARLSQEDLAERSHLHRTYVSLVERGQRNLAVEALRRIGVPAWPILAEAEEDGS